MIAKRIDTNQLAELDQYGGRSDDAVSRFIAKLNMLPKHEGLIGHEKIISQDDELFAVSQNMQLGNLR